MLQKRNLLFFLIVLILAINSFNILIAQDAAETIQWDTISLTVNDDGLFVINPSGTAYARANNGDALAIVGSGTFSTSDPTMVTGGGTWNTTDWDGNPIGNGTFTVTEVVSWEAEEGALPADFFIDGIAPVEDSRAGLVVLRVAYSNEDGSPAGNGVIMIACRLPGSPFNLIEGIVGTKGTDMYLETAEVFGGVDVNYTIFHVIP